MRLAIADPPYLGRAEMFYGARDVAAMNRGGKSKIWPTFKADTHPDAHQWDNPDAHQALVERLTADYDGWAIAMAPDNLRHYLTWVPPRTRVTVWHDPGVMPTNQHPRRRWEPVLVYVPDGRRRVTDVPHPTGDVLTCNHQTYPTGKPRGPSFAGAKPPAWTRWVLDMLGYDQDQDTVADLFGGAGLVTAEINQQVLRFGS
jgi:hypothetical protein